MHLFVVAGASSIQRPELLDAFLVLSPPTKVDCTSFSAAETTCYHHYHSFVTIQAIRVAEGNKRIGGRKRFPSQNGGMPAAVSCIHRDAS